MFAVPARFRGLPPRFWWLWGGLAVNRAGQFVQPLLTFYLTKERGFSLAAAAGVVSAYGFGSVLGAFAGGVVADRLGRRTALLLSAVSSAVMLLLLARARAYEEIVVAAVGLAFVFDLHRPAVHAMVADLVPPVDRLRAYALLYVAVNLGFAAAPTLAGWLAGQGYGLIFAGAAAVQVGWALFVATALPESRPEPVAGAPTVGIEVALRDGPWLAFLAVTTLVALLPHQGFVALSAWMAGQGHDPATFGSVMGLNGLLIVLVQPWVAPIVARHDPMRVFALSCLLYGAGFAMHGLGAAVALHLAAVSVWTLGEIIGAPVLSTVCATLAPPAARGRYQGMLATSFAAAGCVGPLLGAGVMQRVGGAVLWAGCLGLGVCAAGLGLALGPRLRRRLAEGRELAEGAV